jgi:hypothetical protein
LNLSENRQIQADFLMLSTALELVADKSDANVKQRFPSNINEKSPTRVTRRGFKQALLWAGGFGVDGYRHAPRELIILSERFSSSS